MSMIETVLDSCDYSVSFDGESDWYYSPGDAENDCYDKLDSWESDEISTAESNGCAYIGGSTSSPEIEYDEDNDLYRCRCERVLNFGNDNINLTELSFDDIKEQKVYKSQKSQIQKISVDDKILPLLKAKFPDHKKVTVNLGIGRVKIEMPRQIRFLSLQIVDSDIRLADETETISIPLEEKIKIITFKNCGELKQKYRKEESFEITKGTKIEFKKVIESSMKISGKLKFGSYGEAGAEFSSKTSITNSRTITNTRKEVTKEIFEYVLPENTIYRIKYTLKQFAAKRNFDGNILIDGKIQIIYGSEKKTYSLKEIISEDQRKFQVSGAYSNIDFEQSEIDIQSESCN